MLSDSSFVYIEDDPLSREIMHVILADMMGVQHITIFDDTHDIMARMAQVTPTPDYILLDIHIDPLNGFEVIRLIRADAHYQNTKVIALTASVMNDEIENLRQSGFDGAIGKPLNAQLVPSLFERIAQGEAVWHIE